MITFFRGALRSPLVLGLFALILVAFAITSVDSPSGLGSFGGSGDEIADIGRQSITTKQAEQRIQGDLSNQRQQQPGLDMLQFAQSGGVERTILQMVNGAAVEEFAHKYAMGVSKRQIDGEIASIPAFNGPTGKFDAAIFRNVIAQQRLTESEVRTDFERQILAGNLIVPPTYAIKTPAGLAKPYAGLPLEAREGDIAIIPAALLSGGTAPTPVELQIFYKRNSSRYTVPETRSIRYALIDRSRFASQPTPTDAELATAYKAKATLYKATETRAVEQVIVQSEATAKSIFSKAGTTSLTQASKAAGFESILLAPQDKTAFSGLSNAAIGTAVFAAEKNAIIAPMKSPLGWHIVRVQDIYKTAAKPLSAVRNELSAEIAKTKIDDAIVKFIADFEDSIVDGSTFDDVVRSQSLRVVSVPAVTAGGIAPDNPKFQAPTELPPILRSAFQDEADADPQVVTLAPGQAYAFYDLDRINAAAPRPFAMITNQVSEDFKRDRAVRAAKKMADAIVAKVGKGMTLSAAVAAAGVKLPTPRPIGGTRIEITQATKGKVPPPLALLFSMAAGTAKALEVEGGQGWYIVNLRRIQAGDANQVPGLLEQTQTELAQILRNEYGQQLTNAIRADLGVTQNEAVIKQLKARLTGTATK